MSRLDWTFGGTTRATGRTSPWLSVSKPRGMTRYGRRKQHEQRTVRQAEAITSANQQSAWLEANNRAGWIAVHAAGPGIGP
jgi:hypothetical protein